MTDPRYAKGAFKSQKTLSSIATEIKGSSASVSERDDEEEEDGGSSEDSGLLSDERRAAKKLKRKQKD